MLRRCGSRRRTTQIVAVSQGLTFVLARHGGPLSGAGGDAMNGGDLAGVRRHRTAGFTLVELITIMVVAAILAAVAAPRFFTRLSFEERGFYDQSVAAIRYAQRVAIAERRNVFVVMEANRLRLCYDAACVAGVREPGAGNAYDIGTPDGVGLDTTATFSFNGLGQPSLAANMVVTVTGQDNRTFTVQQETGFVATP
ncbi:MAG: prepilin-type N-terminal cleavage/methylation domain-containing protein [Denitratisoma sp.]|nr:prepilin-type N-terminal cleavage/methylation domain-containing protein [Denitratisoma sp.]